MTTSHTEGLARSWVVGVQFIAEPFETVRRAVSELLTRPERTGAYLCPTGAHGVIEAQKDPAFRSILNGAAFNIADGMPVVLVSKVLGFKRAERAFGPAMMWAILQDSATYDCKHFFYGGNEGVAEELRKRTTDALKGLEVVGTFCPPFRELTPDEEDRVVEQINGSGADVVWVGLSTPKQERWVSRMCGRLDVKLLCSVGAAFDYHTGAIKPAPKLMARLALEWLYRLLQEPRRLWRRYFEIVPRFALLASLQVLRIRQFPRR